jgi:choline dehydrogenase
VLLLEYGGQFTDALADASLLSPASDSSPRTTSSTRARVLGGESCLNAGFCTRASSSYVRAAGWTTAMFESINESLLVRRQRRGWPSSLLRAATLSPGSVVSSPPPPPALQIGYGGH